MRRLGRRAGRSAIPAIIALLTLAAVGEAQQSERGGGERRAEAERILRQYLDGWETGDPAIFEPVLAPDFVDYMYGQPRSREELLRQAAAPQVLRNRVTIDDLLMDGDLVTVRVTNHFVHPGSGATATMTGMIVARIRDGRMVEGWGVHDRLGLYQQMGVVPEHEDLAALLRQKLQVP